MKILIADDHWMVREALKQVMQRVRGSSDPLEAGNFEEALAILRAHPDVDLMLIDLIMPGFDEFEGLKRLRSEFPEVPVVVVSVHEDLHYVLRSISHGVIGYIPKSSGASEVVRALERVLSGEVSFPRHILEQGIAESPLEAAPTPPARPAEPPAQGDELLTNREREVLTHLGKGLSVQRIAKELGLSPNTVRAHLGSLMKKLGFRDRASVIHYAVNRVGAKRAS